MKCDFCGKEEKLVRAAPLPDCLPLDWFRLDQAYGRDDLFCSAQCLLEHTGFLVSFEQNKFAMRAKEEAERRAWEEAGVVGVRR